jgi:hypothetical protein
MEGRLRLRVRQGLAEQTAAMFRDSWEEGRPRDKSQCQMAADMFHPQALYAKF